MYARRRKKLLDRVGDATIILSGASEVTRNDDQHYPFRQNSDFYYFTGLCEPDATAVLQRKKGVDSLTLFVRPRDKLAEAYMGARIGVEGALKNYGAHEAYANTELDKRLDSFLKSKNLYLPHGKKNAFASHVGYFKRRKLKNITPHMHDMRLIKDALELVPLRQAARISALGHLAAMRSVRPHAMEYELQAEVEYEFRKHGASTSFNSIVAGGAHALCLHYTENNNWLRPGDLLLVDAGAEYQLYAGDITSTFPINGRFTREQRTLYECVLAAQHTLFEHARAGTTLHDMQRVSFGALADQLHNRGIVTLTNDQYKEYFLHPPSHTLGLDVHDVDNGWDVPLAAGTVFSVEPGIYVPQDDTVFPKEYHGIGIRIEDSVHLSDSGPQIITQFSDLKIPRTPDAIEQFMREYNPHL